MSDALTPVGGKSFEGLRQTNDHGAEYWSARDLQPLWATTSGGGSTRRFDGP